MASETLKPVQRRRAAALRYWCLIAANYLAWIGSVTTLIVVPLYVLESTGRAFDAGLAGAANTLPMAIGGMLGGAIVDRIGPRLAGAAAGLAGAACMIVLPVLHETIGLPFGALLLILFLRSLFDTPTAAARLSLLATLADDAGYQRDTANAVFQAGQRVALVIGPPFAAFLIASIGTVATLYVDAVAFAAAAGLLLVAASKSRALRTEAGESLIKEFVGGLNIIRHDKRLLAMVRIFVVTNLIEDAFAPVILPVYARTVLGDPLAVSLPIIFFGLGAIIGTFAYVPIVKFAPSRFAIFIASIALIALSRTALVALPGPVGLSLLSFVVGFASGPLNPIIITLIQDTVPEEALGRTFGALMGIAFAAIPLGVFLGGVLIDAIGLQGTLALYAAIYVAVVIHAARTPGLRTL